MKDIDQEIEKLLQLKAELDKINELKKSVPNLQVVSQLMYDHLSSKNLIKSDVEYYIASIEIKDYLEGFRG